MCLELNINTLNGPMGASGVDVSLVNCAANSCFRFGWSVRSVGISVHNIVVTGLDTGYWCTG